MSIPDSTGPTRYVDADGLGRGPRSAVIVLVALLHLALAFAILRGLGGVAMLPGGEPQPATAAYDVPLDKPSPQPTATTTAREPEGAEGAAGRKARATQIVAAPARISTRAAPAAPAASTGNDTRSGESAAGAGTGGGAAGSGTGSGGSGNGAGGRYVATRAVKIAGDITSARDYPREGRDARVGRSVVILLKVGTDGRVRGCRVYRPSGDANADAVTCALAVDRFRFRPALDQTGAPVESTYGWEQRWFAP
ncbi:energy transducer TonB [Novosphingobium sp. KCTC 2891]|uniref:energy transducer TonB n=1 Tax=Novosphingobium sp. KCTC 2891 TaxID=2989730 RepID=UPI0022214D45|nr:energy transducer TonB [Novosphingobium sp. KCTC 2891]MCW1383837.1 energy transducer TonB [Novosphingobium sp. KCTC 2891]